jgi:hypothetical protein
MYVHECKKDQKEKSGIKDIPQNLLELYTESKQVQPILFNRVESSLGSLYTVIIPYKCTLNKER